MNEDNAAVIEQAENILRAAVGDTEQLLDAAEVSLRLAAEQLQMVAEEAQDALRRLLEGAEAYAAAHAQALAQIAALGLSAPRWPAEGATPLESGIDAGGTLIVRGRGYAGHSPAEILARTLSYVMNEFSDVPAGSRIAVELRVHRVGGEQ